MSTCLLGNVSSVTLILAFICSTVVGCSLVFDDLENLEKADISMADISKTCQLTLNTIEMEKNRMTERIDF